MSSARYNLKDSLTEVGTFYHFAYGSNLLRERLKLKNPTAVFVTIGKLEGYKLTFMGRRITSSMAWRGAPATIVETPNEHVWGVVWQLDVADIRHLDRQENMYKAVAVGVKDPNGKLYVCRSYELDPTSFRISLPSPQYLDVIQRGAVQNNLPEDYIDVLRKIQHNGNTEAVKVYEDVMKLIDGDGQGS